MKSTKHIIVAGEGVGACRIGADKQTAIDLFGTPKLSKHSSVTYSHLQFPHAGVEVAFEEDNRISAFFFYFRSPTEGTFNGSTSLDIGIDSTVDDVLAKYGKPTKVTELTDKCLDYDALGISFTFNDGLLADIRVQEPKVQTWPEEWPLQPTTDAGCWVAFVNDDGSWLKPVEQAQATFLEFARIAELEHFRVVPTFEVIAIKAFFETMPGNPMFGEHMFLTDVSTNGKTITATLNSSAFRRKDLKEGQEVTFPIEHLSDWFLVRLGKGVGGFTIANVKAELSEEEQVSAAESPPFIWFAHRNCTAAEELIAMPQCSKCKRRNLMIESSFKDGICEICHGGGRRCECPKCGAPLIRFEKLPALCSRCLATR